jgi:hypothetical protein
MEPAEDRPSPLTLTLIQVACLDFCMELLNQRIQVEEYECALICALAVLGRGENRWRDPESYPPILSKVIKITRFMVVHKAMRLDPNASQMMVLMRERQMDGDWETESPMEVAEYQFSGSDEGYGSDEDGPGDFQSSPPSSPPTSSFPSSDPMQPIMPMGAGTSRRTKPRSIREWLQLFMESFMVRGVTNSD